MKPYGSTEQDPRRGSERREEDMAKRFSLEPHEAYLILRNLGSRQAWRFATETEAMLFAAAEGGRVVYRVWPNDIGPSGRREVC